MLQEAIPKREHRLQPLHRMLPFGCTEPADGVLIAKQADFIESFGSVHGVEPFHAYKVFGLLEVLGCDAIERVMCKL